MKQLIIRGDRTKGKLIAVTIHDEYVCTHHKKSIVTCVGIFNRVDRYTWEFRPTHGQPVRGHLPYLIIKAETANQTEETKHLYWTIETKREACKIIRAKWLEKYPDENPNFRGFRFDGNTGIAVKTVFTEKEYKSEYVNIEIILNQSK